MMTRRGGLRLAAGAAAATALRPRLSSAGMPRLAAIDWAALETALAMGASPVAAAELRQYAEICVEPTLPQGIIDIGLRGAPNYELLRMVAPDLVLTSNFYSQQQSCLAAIAPTLSLPVHMTGRSPYLLAGEAARTLGDAIGMPDAAEALVGRSEEMLRAARRTLPTLPERPVYIVSIGDARHVRVFGSDSLFGEVLERLGGRNAWPSTSRYSAAAPVGIEALAEEPGAVLVIVGPTPPDAERALDEGAIWRALPMVREARVHALPPMNHFGALPAACRFARCLGTAMAQPGEGASGQ